MFLCGHVYAQTKTEVQSTPTSSSFPSLSDRNAIKVTFCCDSDGTPTPINWGMDTAWDDEGNILRGINFIGKENLTYGRISFQVMEKVNADGQVHWNWVATDGATFINPAHKAYLVSKKDTQTPTISLETITAISRIQADGKSHAKGTYNLAGQRVDDTYPSIIITDGKKILPKKR